MGEAERRLRRLHWPALKDELIARTVDPAFHPSFVIFFIVAIIGIGPTGFWIELYSYWTTTTPDVKVLRASFISFVPAFVAATTMQLIWAESQKRSLRAFAVLVLFTCMVALIFCSSEAIPNCVAVGFGIASAAIAFWMWWIANAKQSEFQDVSENSYTAPTGGDLETAPPLSGNLAGFKTE